MKRIVNIRPLFLIFLGVVAGIMTANIFFDSTYKNSNAVLVVFCAVVFLLLATITLVFLLKQKNYTFINYLYKNKSVVISLLIGLVLGGLVMSGFSLYYKSKMPAYNGTYQIVGEISDNIVEKENYTMFVLSNSYIIQDGDATNLNSKVRVVVFQTGIVNADMVSAKNKISFEGDLSTTPYINEGYNYSNYLSNVVYFAKVNNNVEYASGSYKLDEYIRDAYKNVFVDNLNPQYSGLAYSLVFGGSSGLEQEVLNVFSVSGLVHIISVSGFHIAVLMAVLHVLLLACKANKNTRFIANLVVLLFYSYLCGFVPTVVRSAIMGMVLLLSLNVGEKYDGLNALSLAGIIILLYSPLSLFNIGFLLSFTCLFAIITVVPVINGLYKNNKTLKSIMAPINITLAVTLLTYPIVLFYFKQLPTYSVLSNLVVAPILSVSYVMVFLLATITMFLPFLGILFVVPQMLMHFSILILNVIVNFPFSYITLYSDGFLSLTLLLLAAFLVKFVMISKNKKTIIILTLCVFVVGLTYYNNIPASFNNTAITSSYQNKSNAAIITTKNNQRVLVGVGFYNQRDLDSMVYALKIKKIDGIVAYDFKYDYKEKIIAICNDYGVKNLVIVNSGYDESMLMESYANVNVLIVNDSSEFELYGVTYGAIFDIDNLLALSVQVGGNNILFFAPELTSNKLQTLNYYTESYYDAIFVGGMKANLAEYGFNAKMIIAQSNNQTQNAKMIFLNELTTFTFEL